LLEHLHSHVLFALQHEEEEEVEFWSYNVQSIQEVFSQVAHQTNVNAFKFVDRGEIFGIRTNLFAKLHEIVVAHTFILASK